MISTDIGVSTAAADVEARYPSLAPKKDSATPDLRGSSAASFRAEHAKSHLFAQYASKTHSLGHRHSSNAVELPEGFPALSADSKAKADSPGPSGLFEEYQEDESNTEQ